MKSFCELCCLVILELTVLIFIVNNGEAFYASEDDDHLKLSNLYNYNTANSRFGGLQKREEEQSMPVLYNDEDDIRFTDDEITAQKRHLCRKYFVYNPVRGRCSPTLLALRKGRRSRNSYGWMSRF